MQRIVWTITILLLSADAVATTKQTIRTKLREIHFDLQNTDAGTQELSGVLKLLNEAQDILITGSASTVDFRYCYNFLYPLYDKNYSSSQASTKASTSCRLVQDMDVLEYSFDKFDKSLSTSNAIDKAVMYNQSDIRGKLAIIEFAFEKYDRGYSSLTSIERALKGAALVRKDALSCLRIIFPQHDRTNSSVNAMDKTFQDCK